jgi:hypothetical protein
MNGTTGRLLLVYCIAGFAAGCSGDGLPEGETGTVRGRVTYSGQPVPEGSVVMFMGSETGILGTGVTDTNGEYLLSMRDGLSILVGTYRVSVNPPNPGETLSQEEVMERSMAGSLPNPADVKEIPVRYRNPESSTLVFEVKPGANTFDIDMKD